MSKKPKKQEIPEVEAPENVAQKETPEVAKESPESPAQEEPVKEAPEVEAPEKKEAPADNAEQHNDAAAGKQKPAKPAAPAVAPTAPTVKKVKMILTQDIDSYINGERYCYPTKKMIEVPADVAQILVHGNKGYRM